MAIDLLSITVQTGLIAAILAGFLAVIRFRMTKWVSLGFARMMKTLNKQAAEDEGAETTSASSNPGTISLGGFKIGLQDIAQLASLAKELGFLKGGSGGGGGW